MVNIRIAHATRKFLICSTTVAVTLANIIPAYGYQPVQLAITLNDINLAIKFEKLITKANKYFKLNDTKKLLEVMLDIKHETEGYTGQKIDLNQGLDQVNREIKAKGGKISKSEMKALKKFVKDSEKKHNHKAHHMAACMESNAEYNPEMVALEFDCLYKAGKGKDNDEGEEMVLPVRVTIGVIMALCGVFITVLPLPPCKTYGPQLIAAGVGLAIEGGCGKAEEDRKKDKDKNRL